MPSVEFWFKIYTQYPSSVSVIHDKEEHGIIYGATDNEVKFKKELETKLKTLISNKKSYPGLLANISRFYKFPKSQTKRKVFINKLIGNLRGQRGQSDMIKKGLIRYSEFSFFLERMIKEFNLPKELIAITFLESSFNPKAHSKAYAAGPWQFMPLIASYFLPPRNRYIDYSFNTILSSISAFHLLNQNIQILKTYDLAVTAYNSGTKTLLNAKKKDKKATNLEYIIKHHKGKYFGFASKNFYSEFLALTRVLAYKNEIFKNLPKDKKEQYYVYTSNCRLNAKRILNQDINNHIFSFTKIYPAGTLFLSRGDFNSKLYTKIEFKKFSKNYPKYFAKRFKKKCL